MNTEKQEPPLVVLSLCETERMEALELALEYVINLADGLNYVVDGVPVLGDPQMAKARLLLPKVKWKWVQRR